MNPAQCKMARAALGLSVVKLAKLSDTNKNTVVSFEAGKDTYASTAQKLRDTFEQHGIEFIPENGGGLGVRFKEPNQNDNKTYSFMDENI